MHVVKLPEGNPPHPTLSSTTKSENIDTVHAVVSTYSYSSRTSILLVSSNVSCWLYIWQSSRDGFVNRYLPHCCMRQRLP
jgi:hypothetical protein